MQRIRVGDLVQIITGKDKGKSGKVQRIIDDRVLVEGRNMVIRHTRPSQQNTEGGRIQKEASIHISNVMPIDADSGKPTRVKAAFETEDSAGDGTDVRRTKKRVAVSGAELKTG